MTTLEIYEEISDILTGVWKKAGIDPEPVQGELRSYLEKIPEMPVMDSKHTGDAAQKTWDWTLTHIIGAMSEPLKQFLRDNRLKTPVSVTDADWKASLNGVIDGQRPPIRRFIWTQALMPLLLPVLDVSAVPFLRFGSPVGHNADAGKAVNDELNQVLGDDDRFYQRQSYINKYHERRSSLTNTELHYASLGIITLMACAREKILDPDTLLNAFLVQPDAWLNLKNLYPGDTTNLNEGVPNQMFRFLITPERLVALLPRLNPAASGENIYQYSAFMALVAENDAVCREFIKTLGLDFFRKEYERMDISHRVPPFRWPEYARAAYEHGFVLAPYIHNKREDFPPELIDWYRSVLAEAGDLSHKDLHTLFRVLSDYEPDEQVMAFYRRLSGLPQYSMYHEHQMKCFIDNMDTPELLVELALSEDKKVNRHAFQRYTEVKKAEPWTEFHGKPEALISVDHMLPNHDPELLKIVWNYADGNEKEAEIRERVLRSLLSRRYSWEEKLSRKQLEHLRTLGKTVFERLPDLTREIVLSDSYGGLEEVKWYAQFDDPAINRLLLKLVAGSYDFKESVKEKSDAKFGKKIVELVWKTPEDLLTLTPHQLAMVLKYFDAEKDLEELSPFVFSQAAKTTSQELHLFLADWLAPVPCDRLDKLGWLDRKFKRFEAVSVEILLRKDEPAAPERLRSAYPKIKNQTLRDRILDRLEAGSEDTSDLDEFGQMELEALDQVASKKAPKKMNAALNAVWRDDLPETYSPLTESMLKWLFRLCQETRDNAMPRTAKRFMAMLSREQQALLTFHLFEQWFAQKGHARHEWARLFLRDYGDDRLIPLFLKSVKLWNKKSKPKTNKIIGWMGELGSVYALSEVKNIYEGNYSESIHSTAKKVLERVAAMRQLTFEELFEELTPTLDYTREGLFLDAGGNRYFARILSDGKLIIVHENGKKTKTFPKQKKADDGDLYLAAKNRLSFFRKSLKPILKQQQFNIARYLHQGKSWEAARWKKLFLDHPLLGALGQSLIWQAETDSGAQVSFRLSEDFSLITADDEPAAPEQMVRVRLWHPIETDEDDIAAWREHLADYELTPFVKQTDMPVYRLEKDELGAEHLLRYQGHVAKQGSFRGILRKHGFFQEGTGDGGRFYGHYYPVGQEKLTVNLVHTAMTAWMEPEEATAIDHVTFYSGKTRKNLTADQINPRLISWVISVLAEISAKGEGYSSTWQSLF
ncbi:hypothetical protein DENIS_0746 [Desulfonema ishimotonii]|uniref:DUF4132 domain-containing protein n=1 Tax=Desulfonema ishimotonii TaxID=45657 RepID=A0A401FS67_9BACT|nr:DUF4132 domain-containing protein [Desulfonema ishimotonii]GBC59805.1 hypothetical protein DENIS_0746 [Desulfonema ishimotonii]